MKITKANIDELKSGLDDILNDSGPQISEAAEVWLDDDADREERAEARETLDNELDTLQGQLEDLVKLLA